MHNNASKTHINASRLPNIIPKCNSPGDTHTTCPITPHPPHPTTPQGGTLTLAGGGEGAVNPGSYIYIYTHTSTSYCRTLGRLSF